MVGHLSSDTVAGKVKVMIVGSGDINRLFSRILRKDPAIRIVGSVADAWKAVEMVHTLNPAVILLDFDTPAVCEYVGASVLDIMPTITAAPIVAICNPGERNTSRIVQALQAGVVDILPNPMAPNYLPAPIAPHVLERSSTFGENVRSLVKALGSSKSDQTIPCDKIDLSTQECAQCIHFSDPQPSLRNAKDFTPRALAIGSSTGGPEALRALLSRVSQDIGIPIFITQHTPVSFAPIMANCLANKTGWDCQIAVDGEEIRAQRIYFAPGGRHMTVRRVGKRSLISLYDGEPENYCRPAVDPMLRSLVQAYGDGILSVILTGMGCDGMKGARMVVEAGGSVLAQDKESSVVWGMPGAVAKAGLSSAILPLDALAMEINRLCGARSRAPMKRAASGSMARAL